MIDVLQSLLDESLLSNIGSDEDFQNLQRAAGDLSESLLDDYEALLQSTLAALDPDTTDDDPSLELAEEKIRSHWTTFRNQFQTGAALALRAVVLDALARASEEEVEAVAIVWYAGTAPFKYEDHQGIGKVIKRFLTDAGNEVEAAAHELWSPPSDPEIETIHNVKFEASEADVLKVDKKSLMKGLQAAAVPHDTSGNNLEGNSQYPHDSNTSRSRQWGKQFAEHAADTIVKAFHTDNIAEELETALRSHSHSIRSAVRKSLMDAFAQMRTRQLRLDLMWWMRTKSSPLLRRSYREIESRPLLLFMVAFDLHQQVPKFAPQSVEYLLREYAHELNQDDVELSVEELLKGLSAAHIPSELTDELEDSIFVRDGRNTLASAASSVAVGTLRPEELDGSISSLLDETIPASDLAVQLFRAFQAERLTASS